MKAIGFSRYGVYDQLQLVDVPEPAPKANELLIRVRASSVNSWDWELLNGTPYVNRLMYGIIRPRRAPLILGADIAGVVEAVGADVAGFQPGDEVFGDLWSAFGGFAEYACAPAASMFAKPAELSFEGAASIPQAGVLALSGIRKGGNLESGKEVLINGGGGGVGAIGIQLAKLAGADVTAVDNAHKLSAMQTWGADRVIDYAEQDYTRSGKQYDLIIDCQAWRRLSDYVRALKPGGTFGMIGGSMGLAFRLMFRDKKTGDGKRLSLVADGPNKDLEYLSGLLDTGRLESVIDRTYSLDQVPEAFEYFGSGHHTGKIAITMPDN